jgi:hypothetical protein
MNIAVKLQKDNPNKHPTMPDEWPWDCREIGEETKYEKEGAGWVVMDAASYKRYLTEKLPLYEAHKSSLPIEPLPIPEAEKEKIKLKEDLEKASADIGSLISRLEALEVAVAELKGVQK